MYFVESRSGWNRTGGAVTCGVNPFWIRERLATSVVRYLIDASNDNRVSKAATSLVRSGVALPAFAAITLASIFTFGSPSSRADAPLTYSVDFHALSAGGARMHNSCFHLAGTVAQAAPGYSNTSSGAPTYSVYAGFWSAAASAGSDGIFFTGFEEC